MDEGFGISPEMLVKAAGYAAWMAAAGACAVRWLIVPRLAPRSYPDAAGLLHSAATTLVAASAVALGAVLLRAWAHTVAAFGYEESFVWENIRLIALESRWGEGWSWQALAAGATFISSLAVKMGWGWGWMLASVAVAASGAAIPLVGHAAGDGARMALHAAHLAGGGLWIGSLFVLFVDLVRRRRGTEPFELFAPVALTGSSIIVLSGLIAAALYVGTAASLFGTSYGRTLLVKVALFAGAAAYGFVNWRRLQQVSDGRRTIAHREMAGTAGRELAIAAALVVATGILTELPNP